jgi:hypothetical protein
MAELSERDAAIRLLCTQIDELASQAVAKRMPRADFAATIFYVGLQLLVGCEGKIGASDLLAKISEGLKTSARLEDLLPSVQPKGSA